MPSTSSDCLNNNQELVLVTGASGYVALHCVRELLSSGYRVRGTVRDKNNKRKISPLLKLPHAAERLELVEADLLRPEEWQSAIDGCQYIFHVASPWPIIADESIIKTAVEGTLTVLRAATNCPSVRKIVLTSSCAAINDGHKNNAAIFDETYWTKLSCNHIENYARSKTLAELAAWKYWNSIQKGNKYQLTVLNPTLVMGPVLSDVEHGSATILGRMMDFRTYLAAPQASVGFVDVRDVARAHVLCLHNDATNGERILISNRSIWFKDMTKWLRDEFHPMGYYITPVVSPMWLLHLYAATRLDSQVNAIMHRTGPELRFNNSKSVNLLGLQYIDPHQSILEMMYSMIDHGMVKATKEYLKRRSLQQQSLPPASC